MTSGKTFIGNNKGIVLKYGALAVVALIAAYAGAVTNRLGTAGFADPGAMTNGVFWMDAQTNACAVSESLDPQTDYIVGTLRYTGSTPFAAGIRTFDDKDTVFSGRSLTIGEPTYSKGYARLYIKRDSRRRKAIFENDGLFLQFGCIGGLGRNNAEYDVYGKMTVLATGTGNKVFNVGSGSSSYSGQTVILHGPLYGAANAVISAGGAYTFTAATALFMDVSPYLGRLDCLKGNKLGASGESAASVKILSGGTFMTATPTNGLTISSLTMETGSVLRVTMATVTGAGGQQRTTNALIRVTGDVTAGSNEGTVSLVAAMSDIRSTGEERRFPVLAVPKAAQLLLDRFTLDLDMGSFPASLRRLVALTIDRGETEDVLTIVSMPVGTRIMLR